MSLQFALIPFTIFTILLIFPQIDGLPRPKRGLGDDEDWLRLITYHPDENIQLDFHSPTVIVEENPVDLNLHPQATPSEIQKGKSPMDPIQIAQIEENGSKGKEKGKEPIIPYTEEHALSRQNTEFQITDQTGQLLLAKARNTLDTINIGIQYSLAPLPGIDFVQLMEIPEELAKETYRQKAIFMRELLLNMESLIDSIGHALRQLNSSAQRSTPSNFAEEIYSRVYGMRRDNLEKIYSGHSLPGEFGLECRMGNLRFFADFYFLLRDTFDEELRAFVAGQPKLEKLWRLRDTFLEECYREFYRRIGQIKAEAVSQAKIQQLAYIFRQNFGGNGQQ